jgi:hypothetical protein
VLVVYRAYDRLSVDGAAKTRRRVSQAALTLVAAPSSICLELRYTALLDQILFGIPLAAVLTVLMRHLVALWWPVAALTPMFGARCSWITTLPSAGYWSPWAAAATPTCGCDLDAEVARQVAGVPRRARYRIGVTNAVRLDLRYLDKWSLVRPQLLAPQPDGHSPSTPILLEALANDIRFGM